jgi:hypothetical protein
MMAVFLPAESQILASGNERLESNNRVDEAVGVEGRSHIRWRHMKVTHLLGFL